jgi:serine/threonine-protein kinase HipA
MAFQHLQLLDVKYVRGSEWVQMGRLALKEGAYFFEYAPAFLELGLELSPFKLPLRPGIIRSEDRVFDGLFGVFNDCLPDGWGRLLLDRKLRKMGLQPEEMSCIDRLRFVGTKGMGALRFLPVIEEKSHPLPPIDLDLIENECLQVLEDEESPFIDDLLVLNGSSAGARPKILITIDNEDWIVKFRSSTDPKDVGPIEFAYHLMAEEAGLVVPKAKLFKSKITPGYFGVKRFDHEGGKSIHMHTASGLLHADHRLPSLDYKTLLKATLWLTKDARQVEEQFRNAAFNVLGHNRDDHGKNFSFLMDSNGRWRVSPAYDLIFSHGPGGEHCTSLMGEGKNPGSKELLKLAKASEIEETVALNIMNQVKEAIAKWPQFAKQAGVSATSTKLIKDQLLKG